MVRAEAIASDGIRLVQVMAGSLELPEIPVGHSERVANGGLQLRLMGEDLIDLPRRLIQGFL